MSGKALAQGARLQTLQSYAVITIFPSSSLSITPVFQEHQLQPIGAPTFYWDVLDSGGTISRILTLFKNS
jgi:hypothetical protein